MTTQSHSPLPWTSNDSNELFDANGRFCAQAFSDSASQTEEDDNAQLIVSAVNSHSALVEALRECITDPFAYCLVHEDKAELYRRICAINEVARKALDSIANPLTS